MPNRTSDDTLQTLRLMWAEQVILRQTQTVKDILNCLGNSSEHTPEELRVIVESSYQLGVDYLDLHGIEEIC